MKNIMLAEIICELCEKKVDEDNSYKGTFERICKDCWGDRLDSLFTPLHEIEEGIYLGNEEAATTQTILAEHKIGAICVCGKGLKKLSDETFQYLQHEIHDKREQKIVELFQPTNKWINRMRQEGKNVLIHCAAGVSRSASFTIAYLMAKKQLPLRNAFIAVKRKRKCAQPNEGFLNQLQLYEESLKHI